MNNQQPTQADREAAEPFQRPDQCFHDASNPSISERAKWGFDLVQAFARHRLAAIQSNGAVEVDYDDAAQAAVMSLLERGRATVNRDGNLVLVEPHPQPAPKPVDGGEEVEPAVWALAAEKASMEAFAMHMGDPDGNDNIYAARCAAAAVIEQYAKAALEPASPAAESGVREAAQAVIDRMASTYRARNGKEIGIQGDDGEKCWIVHSDEMAALETALSRVPASAELGNGKEMSLIVALDFADNPRPYHSLAAPADTNGELYEALRVLAKSYRAATLSRTPAAEPDSGEVGKSHRMLLDLLAVIHRDGGHTTQEIGVDLAYEQAMELAAERVQSATESGEVAHHAQPEVEGMWFHCHCSCGWRSEGYFDGAAYAREEWNQHAALQSSPPVKRLLPGEVYRRADKAADEWRVPCSTTPGDTEMCKPKEDCVWGFRQGYLAALASPASEEEEG